MAAHKDIWIFSEKAALAAEMIAGACSLTPYLGGRVAVIVAGPKSEVDKAVSAGAEKVYWLKAPADTVMLEDYVPTIAGLMQSEKPLGLFVGATRRGKAVAGRLGAILGATVITDVKNFVPDNNELQVAHRVFGGSAIRFETHASEMMLATVGMGTFEPMSLESNREGEIIEVDFVEPQWRLTLLECREKPPSLVNLPAAKRVVCPGCGLAKEEDLAMIQDLAEVLSAEIGCTRTLAERIKGLSQEQHIGISGVNIKPELYIGIGVSGQVQHTAGITDSKVVVAIDKDRNAPIFFQADYGIVGDLYEVVPAFIKALKDRK